MNNLKFENLKHLFPDNTSVNKSGRLEINNNDISDLVKNLAHLFIFMMKIQLEMLQKTILINSSHNMKMFMFHILLKHFQIQSFHKFK